MAQVASSSAALVDNCWLSMLLDNDTNYVFCSKSDNSGGCDSSLSYGAVVASCAAAVVGGGSDTTDGVV